MHAFKELEITLRKVVFCSNHKPENKLYREKRGGQCYRIFIMREMLIPSISSKAQDDTNAMYSIAILGKDVRTYFLNNTRYSYKE